MRVTLVSTQPVLSDKQANLATMAADVQASTGDLVVFPEMALTGYLVGDRVHRLAESIDGPAIQHMSEVARKSGRWVLFGMPRSDEDRLGLIYNSAVLVDPDGGIQVYDKRQLATFGPFEDGIHFTAGRTPGVMETPWGTLGVSICYDLFFPELHKAMTLDGADVLVNISASPSTSRRFFEALFAGRAIESALPVLYSNFAGSQDGLMFWGGCQYWGPRGTCKAVGPYFEPHRLEVEVDFEETRAARPLRPTLRDTRRDTIEDLLAAYDRMAEG